MTWGEASKEVDRARGVVVANHDGFMVKSYDIGIDNWVWTFGHLRLPILHDHAGSVYGDDPWGGRDAVPIDDLRDYLEGWYWPRLAETALPVSTPLDGDVLRMSAVAAPKS